jgi:choline-glycine betaine transporter
MNILNFIKQLLKDKTHNYSMRESVIAISMILIIISWLAQILFGKSTPEYMFYSIVSLIATGCFGYSIEKPKQ